MTSKYELARALFRNSRDVVMEGFGGTLPSYQVEAVAVSDSNDGTVLVALDGETFTEDGDVAKYSSTSDGTEVTLVGASSISAFSVDGQTTQEGETITSISSLALVVTRDGVEVSSTTVDLDGNELRSLPDGTCDVLFVGEEGSSYIAKTVGVTLQAETDGIEGTVGQDIISSTGVIEDGATVLYPLYEVEYVTLPQFTYPEVEDGDVLATDPSAYFEVTWALAEPVEGTITPDMQFVAVPCSSEVMEGDTVIVTVQANKFVDATVIGSGDRIGERVATVNAAAAAAATLAQEAKDIADAIGQYAWNDTSGTHVSTEEGVAEGTRNILLNSYGILLRAAANYLAALSQSGIAFYDGQGNAAENILASFGVSGAQVGRLTEPHIILDNDSFNTFDDQNRLVSHIDSLGWWRYKPVDEYPDGDTSKPVNPGYDPNNPSTLESFIGSWSIDLNAVSDSVTFGDTTPRYYFNDRAGTTGEWAPVVSRTVDISAKAPSGAELALIANDSDSAASIEIVSDGNVYVNGNDTRQNGKPLYWNNSQGNSRQVLQINNSDQLVIGYGGYANQDIPTYVEGNAITLLSRGAVNVSSAGVSSDYAPSAWAYLVGSASGSHVRYCKRAGVVFVEVWYESGAAVGTTAKTLGTLPAGFRPSLQVETCAFGNVNNLAYLRVNPGGSIVAKSMSGTMNYFKGTISFPV